MLRKRTFNDDDIVTHGSGVLRVRSAIWLVVVIVSLPLYETSVQRHDWRRAFL